MDRINFAAVIQLLIFLFVIERSQSVSGKTYVHRITKYGMIRGKRTDKAQVFLGVPYAAPANRWEDAVVPEPWSGVLDTTAVKPMCYQDPNCKQLVRATTCLDEMSEDCLYLNIFAPRRTKGVSKADSRSKNMTAKRAVMIYFHGGIFAHASGGADAFNGENFVSKGDVILVTTNYRLGAFGFLVTGNGTDDIKGNYGIRDQRRAIEWVYENIAYFGGDPERITLFGQSAGAISIAIHMVSQEIGHMFKHVILESLSVTVPLKPYDIAVEEGGIIAGLLNCTPGDVSCLRSKSAAEIATVQSTYSLTADFSDSFLRTFSPWMPSIDGDYIRMSLTDAFNLDMFSPKPAILGTTAKEASSFVYWAFPAPVNDLGFQFFLHRMAQPIALEAYSRYLPADSNDARPEMSDVGTDFLWACSTRHVMRNIGRHVQVYSYVFNDSFSFTGAWSVVQCEVEPCHGVEVAYVFQTAVEEPYLFTTAEFQLSDAVIAYWTNFARTGSPNESGRCNHDQKLSLVEWIPYTHSNTTDGSSMVLQETGNYLLQGYKDDTCNFWDRIEYQGRR